MPLVKFIKENKEIEVPHGANLRKEAIKAGINVHQGVNGFGAGINKFLNCHGLGQCGTCRVKITKGMENTSPMGLMEKVPLPQPAARSVPVPGFHRQRRHDAAGLPDQSARRHRSRNRPATEPVRREFL